MWTGRDPTLPSPPKIIVKRCLHLKILHKFTIGVLANRCRPKQCILSTIYQQSTEKCVREHLRNTICPAAQRNGDFFNILSKYEDRYEILSSENALSCLRGPVRVELLRFRDGLR